MPPQQVRKFTCTTSTGEEVEVRGSAMDRSFIPRPEKNLYILLLSGVCISVSAHLFPCTKTLQSQTLVLDALSSTMASLPTREVHHASNASVYRIWLYGWNVTSLHPELFRNQPRPLALGLSDPGVDTGERQGGWGGSGKAGTKGALFGFQIRCSGGNTCSHRAFRVLGSGIDFQFEFDKLKRVAYTCFKRCIFC